MTGIFSGFSDWFGEKWDRIKAVFAETGGFFSEKFGTAWENIKSIFASPAEFFSSGGEIFGGITEGIFGTFKSVVNSLIDGINWVIAQPFWAINWALDGIRGVQIADWYPFEWLPSISIPEIPKLATGTVVPANYGEFLAILGDNRRETEVVSPLSTIEQAVTNAIKKNNSSENSEIHVHVELDGREIGRVAVRAVNQDRKRRGE